MVEEMNEREGDNQSHGLNGPVSHVRLSEVSESNSCRRPKNGYIGAKVGRELLLPSGAEAPDVKEFNGSKSSEDRIYASASIRWKY